MTDDNKMFDGMFPAPAAIWESQGITDSEVYQQAAMIYAKLVSVPRTLQHEQLLELAFQEQGYSGATEAYIHGAAQAALELKKLVEKGLAKNDGNKP